MNPINIPRKAYSRIENATHKHVERLVAAITTRGNIFADGRTGSCMENSMILNGFWRSGTTIAQDLFSESLRAKSCFEPFEPGLPNQARYIFEFARNNGYDASNRPLVALLMPFLDGEKPDDSLWAYLDSVIWGNFSNPGLVRNRKSPIEGIRKNKCIKFVRAHFLLKELWSRYRLPILHVRRHPFSVIASLVKVPNWNQNGFNDMDLHRLLEKQQGCIPANCQLLAHKIDALDRNLSKIEKIAAYWCFTEIVAEKHMEAIPAKALVLQFENLMKWEGQAVTDVIDRLHLSQRRKLQKREFSKMSKTSHYDVKNLKGYDPTTAYQGILSSDDMQKISEILSHFEIERERIEEDVAKNLFCQSMVGDYTGK